jgi:polysaccharide export outer membrane protein
LRGDVGNSPIYCAVGMSLGKGDLVLRLWTIVFLSAFALNGCAFWLDRAPVGPKAPDVYSAAPEYVIGPGDTIQVFVWRSAELSVTVPVRPDGRFSMPLLQDVQAAGKSPSQVSDEIKAGLVDYVRDPQVTVIVQSITGAGVGKVSVIGEVGAGTATVGGSGAGSAAGGPKSIPYRAGLTLLDAMIEVGGITQFANGNDSRLVRVVNGKPKEFRLRVADLLKDGDTTANVELAPGDVIRVPERWF